ncbi:MAG TPA: MJ0042-type zinc finger domain-containing protein, partial [Steroidobacteraceae bacterium]
MFTVCPKCALTLVVTAADLRVAQGYVRCGRCSSVFNALARLSERQAAEAEPAPAPQAGAPAVAPQAPATEMPQVAQPAAGPGAAPERAAEAAPAALPEESALPETALEFNPDTTDVNSVFVAAPPNPQW